MRFESDLLLWLLLIVPPAVLAFYWWAWRQRERLLGQFIEPRLLAGLTAGVSATRRKWKLALLLASVALLIVTLGRPQWGFHWEETRQRGLDIVIGIDTSKSMLADDIAPDRLTRAKLAALDLMQQAQSDRLGLVAFAGNAFLMCPLTIDDGAFRQCVDALDVETIPSGGTALAEAIDTARTAFKEDPDSYKILVLFSDGEDHDERAVAAAEEAAKAGLRIFTIGIGTPEGEMVRLKDAKGRTDFVRDDDGNVVKSKLNEALLQEVARAGNGFYLPLRGAKTMDTLYEQGLAPLPKSESQARLVKRYYERYHWPLALAIALLLLEIFLRERRRSPKPVPARSLTASSAAATAMLLCLIGAGSTQASVSSAQRAYQAGRFEDARKEYDALLLRRAADPRLQFNAGAAAYRDGQFAEAAERFAKAAAAPDLKLQQRAYYNRGNTHYQIGERETEMDKKREAWEQSLKDFEATLKLDAKDADAQHNLEFVKQRLEELKQQEQKQDQQNQDNKDQKDEQNQDKQDQQKQDQKDQKDQPQDKQDKQKKDEQQKQQDQQKQDQQKQQSGQDQKDQQQKEKERQEKAKQEQERQKQKAEQQKQQQEQQKQQGEQDKQSGEPQEGEETAQVQGMLTPQQARQILDAQKTDEKMLPVDIQKQPERPGAPRRIKDW